MTKQKVGVSVVIFLAAIILLAGGFWLGRGHFLSSKNVKLDGATSDYSSGASSGTSNSVPLNQTSTADNNSGGLAVSGSSGATSLGQLGSGNGQNAAGNNTGSGGASSGSSSGSGSSPLDPSTFAQYDKYKDQNQALFGDITKGSGDELTANKKAAVYYKGWLTNGQMFDQSRPGSDGKLQPFVFTLGAHQVITGWEEGMAGMKVGGERLIIVPPSVGYGAQGQSSIPGNAVLVFDVQLLAVQ